MERLTSLSTLELEKWHKYSIKVQGDYRVLRTNDLIYCNLDYMHISALDTNYRVSRVYYNHKNDESTIIIKR